MHRYMICFTLILVFVYSFDIFNLNNLNKKIDNTVSTSNFVYNDTLSPKIESISPSKCEKYIVGMPTIKICYSDNDDIDLSSIRFFINYKDVTKDCIINKNVLEYTPSKKFNRGNQIAKIDISDASNNKTSFEWYFTVGTPIYTHYRGLLHSHTNASDGHGTFDDAYYMSKYKANLDFFAITEHSNMFDNFIKCNLNNADSSEEWTLLEDTKDKFTTSNEFIALRGFEMSYDYTNPNSLGHINIFNSKGFITEQHPNMDNLTTFYNTISLDENLIGQFNHPCLDFGLFNNFNYHANADKIINLIEVGNGYKENTSDNRVSFDKYQLALDKGWHLSPTCNQDNHIVDFGVANEFRTVILATALTEDSIYDALKNRRTYATQDKNLKIDFNINDLPMGTIINNPSKLHLSVSAIDPDYDDFIKEIQIISNNAKLIKSKTFDSNIAKLECNIKDTQSNTFYYIKIIQNNDKVSVTAPIWIK